jgi:UTP--glucose-1-phosphate uridylyltransferase
MQIRKAVIPAAGWGTRMLPAAKAVAKELLPVLDRPTIQYVIEEAAAAGIDDALLVTSRDKRALEDHFDRNRELEERLAAGGKEALLASVAALAERVKVHSVRQPVQRGLGDAVYQARRHVGNETFACLLGDTIFSGGPAPTKQLIEAWRQLGGGAVIGLEEVPTEKLHRYGVVGGRQVSEGIWQIESIVEKPSPQAAPGRLAIAARYVLTPAVFECIERSPAGRGGEVQLSDALALLLQREPVHGVVLRARRHDIGDPVEWLRTNLLFAADQPTLWQALLPTIRELLNREDGA